MEVRRLRFRGRLAPIAVGTLVAIAAATAAAAAGRASTPSSTIAQVVADAQATALTAHLTTDAAFLASAASAVASSTSASPTAATLPQPADHRATVALYGVDGAPPTPASWQLPFDLARDGGATIATAVRDAQRGWVVVLVQPLYRDATTPVQVADRRQSVRGYVVLVEPASSLVPGEAALGDDFRVRVLQGADTLTSYGATGDRTRPSLASAPVTALGVSWMVEAAPVHGASAVPGRLLAAGLLLALVVAIAVDALERRGTRLAREADVKAKRLNLIARAGALLQESLDMSELLPLFAVEVSDELGLEHMAILLSSGGSDLVTAFSVGGRDLPMRIDAGASSMRRSSVAPGEVVTVAMQRSGRLVGAVVAVARDGLHAEDLETLGAAVDLLAAALGNARLFQAEQDMVTRLRELDRLKTTFLGSVSHELRTTVTAIDGFANLLVTAGSTLDDEHRADYLRRVQRNAKSLVVLVDDLLDFARLERAGLSVSPQPFGLSDEVPKIVDQMSSLLGDRPVVLHIRPGVVVRADGSAVERILVNLLSNAAKYTPPGSPVEVSLTVEDEHAVLSVADHGSGIPVEERQRIFELFYRIDNEAGVAARGVGIGLALVRQLVDLLGWDVSVDDTPGGGARFRVTIPLGTSIDLAPMRELTSLGGHVEQQA